MIKKITAIISFYILPTIVFAIEDTSGITIGPFADFYRGDSGVTGLFDWLGVMLSGTLQLIIAVSVVWFVYTVFQYTIRESEKDKEEVKTQIVWGIVGIFIMVSVWGLVNVLKSTFNLSNDSIDAPIINFKNY